MAEIEVPIAYGTVLNPNAARKPKPTKLLDSIDSLSSFPSIQRYQLQKLREQSKDAEPKSDTNSNYLS